MLKTRVKSLAQVAFEELELEAGAAAAADAELPVVVDEALDTTPVDEALTAADDVAVAFEELEQVAETAEVMENIAETIEEGAETEGLNTTGAEAVAVAVEGLSNIIGFTSTARFMPAMEAFEVTEAKPSTAEASKSTAAGIKARANKIWAAFLEMLKGALAAVKEFGAKFFTAIGRTKARAEKIKAKAEALAKDPKAEVKAGKLKLSASTTKVLTAGGDKGNAQEAVKKAKELKAQVDAEAKNEQAADQFVSACSDLVGKVGTDGFDTALTAALKVLAGLGKGGKEGTVKDLPEGFTSYAHETEAGTTTYVVPKENATVEQLKAGLGKVRVSIQAAEGTEDAEVDRLTYKQAVEVVDGVLAALAVIEKGKAAAAASEKAIEELIAKAKTAGKGSDAAAANAKTASTVGHVAVRMTQSLNTTVRATMLRGCSAVLDWSAASIS